VVALSRPAVIGQPVQVEPAVFVGWTAHLTNDQPDVPFGAACSFPVEIFHISILMQIACPLVPLKNEDESCVH
jgi:hypothetical protein